MKEKWFWLCNIKNIQRKKIQSLLDVLKTPEDIFCAEEKEYEKAEGISEQDRENIIQAKKDYEKICSRLEELEKKKIRFISPADSEYPEKLRNLQDKPYGLYVKGNLPEEREICASVIGARACTPYGKQAAKAIAKELAAAGVGVISGLARGIDSMGHIGAIEGGGKTYAVLGSGFSHIYPRENLALFEQIIETGGGVITEFPMDVPPLKQNFPQRNRIISGLSDGVVVIEARVRSGSLITVNYALEQGKDVFALPGRMDDPLSEGCNRLIQKGASIITHPQDVLRELGVEENKELEKNLKKNYSLEKDLEVVYSVLCLFPKNIHIIIEETGMEAKQLLPVLVRLELMGLVWEPMKNYYARKNDGKR